MPRECLLGASRGFVEYLWPPKAWFYPRDHPLSLPFKTQNRRGRQNSYGVGRGNQTGERVPADPPARFWHILPRSSALAQQRLRHPLWFTVARQRDGWEAGMEVAGRATEAQWDQFSFAL